MTDHIRGCKVHFGQCSSSDSIHFEGVEPPVLLIGYWPLYSPEISSIQKYRISVDIQVNLPSLRLAARHDMTERNGYTLLPVIDQDTSGSTSYGAASAPLPSSLSSKRKKGTRNLRPGLFYMFGSRGKYAANKVSVALSDQSESEEQERERIELLEMKPRRTKYRRGRLKSPKSPQSLTARTQMNFNVIEEPILPDDTVQRVSLRYGVPVSTAISIDSRV